MVHVLDASRAVPVTTSLLSDEGRAAFVAEHRADYERLRLYDAAFWYGAERRECSTR